MNRENKTGKNLKSIKAENNKSVINILRRQEKASIKAVSEEIGLSNTAVSKIVNNLIEKDLLIDAGKGGSTDEGGKKPALFAINPDYRYGLIVLVELDGVFAYLYDMALKQRCVYIEKRRLNTYEECLEAILHVAKEISDASSVPYNKLCGIMIGFPGIISLEKGEIVYPICFPEWGNYLTLGEDIRKKLSVPIPVYVENPGRLIVYSELLNTESDRKETIAVIGHDSRAAYNILNGAGGGVIINGELLSGKGNIGEFGHMIVDPRDKVQCRCGRYGCFESTTSISRLLKNAERTIPEKIRIPLEIFERANRGEENARELLETVINGFVIAINNLMISYDPDRIVIFGTYTKAGDYFISRIREKIKAYFPYASVQIEYSMDDYMEKEKLGAALLLFDSFFNQDDLYIS